MDAVRDQREGACVATVGAGAPSYRRHRPEETVLYGVVEQHAEAFFEGQGERGGAMVLCVAGRLCWARITMELSGAL